MNTLQVTVLKTTQRLPFHMATQVFDNSSFSHEISIATSTTLDCLWDMVTNRCSVSSVGAVDPSMLEMLTRRISRDMCNLLDM